MGESDRLVTVLTKEHGLVRAIAPGARKHKSRLGGRSGLFVVNDVLFTRGKSIDKLIQAETLKSFPGLSRDLAKLTASQYLAEIVLALALTEQPQEELYYLLIEHLSRLEAATKNNVLPCLAQATFHFLALAGVAPEVFRCCLSRVPLTVELGNTDWKVGFSVSSGGAVAAEEIERLECDRLKAVKQRIAERDAQRQQSSPMPLVAEPAGSYGVENQSVKNQSNHRSLDSSQLSSSQPSISSEQQQTRLPVGIKSQIAKDVAKQIGVVTYLSGAELALMQQLSKPKLVMTSSPQLPSAQMRSPHISSSLRSQISPESGTIKQSAADTSVNQSKLDYPNIRIDSGPHLMWRHVEQALRQYAQYQFDRPIKSAALIDTCFS